VRGNVLQPAVAAEIVAPGQQAAVHLCAAHVVEAPGGERADPRVQAVAGQIERLGEEAFQLRGRLVRQGLQRALELGCLVLDRLRVEAEEERDDVLDPLPTSDGRLKMKNSIQRKLRISAATRAYSVVAQCRSIV